MVRFVFGFLKQDETARAAWDLNANATHFQLEANYIHSHSRGQRKHKQQI